MTYSYTDIFPDGSTVLVSRFPATEPIPDSSGKWIKWRDVLFCSSCGFGYYPINTAVMQARIEDGGKLFEQKLVSYRRCYIFDHCPVCGVINKPSKYYINLMKKRGLL